MAREGAEQAALGLHEASCPCGAPLSVARLRLAHAQQGERQARHFYQQVAEETGVALSRLAHSVGRP